MSKQLLVATYNPGKMREIQALLEDTEVVLLTPAQVGLDLDVEENGQTYAQNADLKARAFADASGLLTMADDSGLEVDALNGQPGLHSARFAQDPEASDADRRALLLEKLGSIPRPWMARFRCTVALAKPSIPTRFAEGICPGEIFPQERGQNGFGYDPIFYIPEAGKTMAELSMEEKNLVSHRARAVRACLPALAELLNMTS